MNLIRLFRHRSFALLWFAGLISLTGDWLLRVALPIYVYQLTGSAVATSAVVAINVGGGLAINAVAGVLVDRWDRRRLMWVVNVLQAALVLPLVAVHSESGVWIVLLVTAAQSTLQQFVGPAEHALLPRLVPDAELTSANSLNALNNNIARLIGPALGAVVAATMGLAGAAVLDAASFIAAAILVAMIAGTHRAAVTESVAAVAQATRRQRSQLWRLAVRRWRDELVDGLDTVRNSTVLRAVFVVLAVTSVGEGIMASLFPVFVNRGLGGGAVQIGWLMSAQAVGGIFGGLASTVLGARIRPIPMAIYGLVMFGFLDLIIFNYPRWTSAIEPGIVLFILVGVPGAFVGASFMTLLQTEVPDARRGRVFSAALAAEAGAALVGAAVAATLTDHFGVINVLTAQGAGYVLAGFAFAVMVRRRDTGTTPVATRRRAAADAWNGPSVKASTASVLGNPAESNTCDAYRSWQKLEFRRTQSRVDGAREYAFTSASR